MPIVTTTFTWTGASSANWNDPTNWTVNGVTATTVPLAGDNITIPASAANQPQINNGQSGSLVGVVDNDGTITVAAGVNGTDLNIGLRARPT